MTSLQDMMKDSMKRAFRVLRLVNLNVLTAKQRRYVYVEAYENCREQGFTVHVMGLNFGTKYSIAENRNSDDMVLYVGPANDFTKGNVPSTEIYHNRKFFSAEHGDRAGERAMAKELRKLVITAARQAAEEFRVAIAANEAKKTVAVPVIETLQVQRG